MNDSLINHYRSIFNEIAKSHLVPDIIPEKATFLFILESPHIQELKFGAPVSGASGLSMTQHLFADRFQLPLGQLAIAAKNNELQDPLLDHVALMNACQVPLQKAAYADSPIMDKYQTEWSLFEEIRVTNQKLSYSNEALDAIQQVIAGSLHKKLQKLTDRALYIIPCGKFAQKFSQLASVSSPNWEWVDGIPHPSYHNWSKLSYRTAVDRLIALFSSTVIQDSQR